MASYCEYGNEALDSLEGMEFMDGLSHCQPVKEGPAPME
jgi:hypothetical protein